MSGPPARVLARQAMAVMGGLCVNVAGVRSTHAQPEPIYDQLVRSVKRDYLSLEVLFQSVADLQIERTMAGNNGFSVANFRVALLGELDRRFGYLFQTNFAGSPSVLDAKMYYRVSPAVRVDVGQFKAPFSYEFLTYAGTIDFVNRAQAVTALAPGRQIGFSAGLGSEGSPVRIDAGAFNGNSTRPNGNDNDNLLYAARLSGTVPLRDEAGRLVGDIRYGVNGGYSVDENTTLAEVVTGFRGDRQLFGADVRVTVQRLLVSTEFIYANLDPVFGATREPWGGHLTAGFMFTTISQALLRLDLFEPDDGLGRRDWIVLGLNLWPTQVTEFQVNYIVDTDNTALDNHQLLINFQFGF